MPQNIQPCCKCHYSHKVNCVIIDYLHIVIIFVLCMSERRFNQVPNTRFIPTFRSPMFDACRSIANNGCGIVNESPESTLDCSQSYQMVKSVENC